MQSTHSPFQNQLLAALPLAEYQRLETDLEPVELPQGKLLHAPGEHLSHVHFPTTAIVSKLYFLENGASTEVAAVGNEGVLGVTVCMGGETPPIHAVVQNAGWAYRFPAHLMKAEFQRGGPLTGLLLRYTQALMTQITQTAVCNRHHTIEQQLCRWLLLSLDRLSSNTLSITQDKIADMLGVRREGVTLAAGRLQRADLIHNSRGQIKVLDRPGMEARVCECYAVVRSEIERLLYDHQSDDAHQLFEVSVSAVGP